MESLLHDKENAYEGISSPMKSANSTKKLVPLTPRSKSSLNIREDAPSASGVCTPSKTSGSVRRLASCSRCQDMKKQIKAVQGLLKLEQAKSKKLANELINSQEDTQAYKDEHDRILEQYNSLHLQGKRLHKAYMEKHERLEELADRVVRVEAELASKEAMNANLNEQLAGQEEELAALTEELAEKETLLARSSDAFCDLQQAHAALMAEAGTLRLQLAEPAQETRQLQETLEQAQSECMELQQALAKDMVAQIESSALGNLLSMQQEASEEFDAADLQSRLGRALDQLDIACQSANSSFQLNLPASPMITLAPRPTIVVDEHPMTPVAAKGLPKSCATSPLQSTVQAAQTPKHHVTATTMTSPMTPVVNMMAVASARTPSTLLHHIESITISNELLRDRHKSLENEIARCKDQLEAAQQEKMSIAQQCEAERALHHRQMAAQAQGLQDQAAQLQEQLQVKEAALNSETLNAADELVADKHALEVKLASVQSELASKEAEIEELTQQYQLQLSNQEKLTANLQEDLRLVYNKNKTQLAELEAKYKSGEYETRYLNVIAENRALQERVEAVEQLAAEMNGMAELNEALISQIQDAEASLMAREAALKAHESGLELQLADVKQQLLDRQSSNDQLQEEYSTILSERDQLVKEVKQLSEGSTQASSEAASALATAKADMQFSMDELQLELDNEKETCNTLQNKLTAYATQLQQLQKEHESCQAMKDSAREQSDELTALLTKVEDLEGALNDANNFITELESKQAEEQQQFAENLGRLKEENRALEMSAQELIADRFDADNAVEDLKTQLSTVAGQLEEKTAQYNELKEFIEEERMIRQEVIDELEKDNATVQAEVEQLQQALHTKTQENETMKSQSQDMVEEARRIVYAERDEILAQVSRANLEAERLSGELMSKDLSLFEAQSLLDGAQQRILELETASQTSEDQSAEISQLKTYISQYKERTEEKIQVLRENLAKAEAEVTSLDAELTRAVST